MSDALLERVAEQFRALGEPSRLKLMSALFDGELAVGGLAERSGLSLANVSKHLGVLFQAGWVTRRKAGLTVVYALADDRAEHLCELMCDRVRQRAASEASIAGTALPQSRLAARTRPR
jgi:DNA-binding transcriptional ArsR family regulator